MTIVELLQTSALWVIGLNIIVGAFIVAEAIRGKVFP
jgi:hypothetical protein